MTLVLLFTVDETGYKALLVLCGLIAYLLGSIPFGYLIVKLVEGRDIRAAGSGNIGAANVTRTVGKGAGVATLALDAGKGVLAVALSTILGEDAGLMVVAALCAILGHMFPVWLKFKGGKGVATGVGAFLLICWPAVAAAFAVWVAVILAFQYVSLASMTAAAALPPLIYLLYAPPHAPPFFVSLAAVAAAILIIWKHRPNIGRLVAGTEPKLKLKK
jgi:glycerol-3-phosphate acyltransferase PlsY